MTRRAPLATGICATTLLVGCNAMLGISEPSDELLDPNDLPTLDATLDPSITDDAGAGTATPDAHDDDAGSYLPPSNYLRAGWPMPNFDLPGAETEEYEVSADGVVRDTVTKLEWQREASDESYTLTDALAYCGALELDGGGFRLPSRIELTSLLDLSRASPAIDDDAFPDAPAERFWSVSGYAAGTDRAWVVSFSFSTSHVTYDYADTPYRVRCVRAPDEVAAMAPPGLEIADEVVTDPATGLTWQRTPGADLLSIEDARAYCEGLELDGGDFRLPTLKELHTLVAEDKAKPAIDADAFPETPSATFWTSSHVVNFNEYTWTVSFIDGSDVWVAPDAQALPRCVRASE